MNLTGRSIHCAALLALSLALASCGGGGSGGGADCSLAGQKSWLRGYMLDRYYWNDSVPTTQPPASDTLAAYFRKLLFQGAAPVPADKWSYYESTASYDAFFGAGRTLDYGLSVNGIEQVLPLKVRYVEPLSAAGVAGVRRGDTVVSINGVSAADLVAANDYGMLAPSTEGSVLNLVLDTPAGRQSLRLVAESYALTPVPASTVFTLPNGRKAGYLVLKAFITQAEAPLATAFAQFRAAGASELILDLRYNGGGRISSATLLASLVAGVGHRGEVFTRTLNNAQHTADDGSYRFSGVSAAGYSRVVVLTGRRTCSASELVVNGLAPYVEVVTVGEASCGKPFGFNPVASCGNTYSAVNFETVNGRGEGAYYDGIAATCAATDPFGGTLGDPAEGLTAAGLKALQGGCQVPLEARANRDQGAYAAEPGERRGMVAD